MKIIKFDLMGQRRLEFGENALAWHTDEMYAAPLPGVFVHATIRSNVAIAYEDIDFVGITRKRQTWALVAGIVCGLLGLVWMAAYFGDWGPFAFSLVWFLLLGALPVWMWVRARPFLTIGSVARMQVISVPADRSRDAVAEAIETLRARLDGQRVLWKL